MIRTAESENKPTNPKLWENCLKLMRGEIKSFKHDGEVVELSGGKRAEPAQKNSAYLNGRALQKYKSLGGGWKKSASLAELKIANRIAALDVFKSYREFLEFEQKVFKSVKDYKSYVEALESLVPKDAKSEWLYNHHAAELAWEDGKKSEAGKHIGKAADLNPFENEVTGGPEIYHPR